MTTPNCAVFMLGKTSLFQINLSNWSLLALQKTNGLQFGVSALMVHAIWNGNQSRAIGNAPAMDLFLIRMERFKPDQQQTTKPFSMYAETGIFSG